MTIRPQAMSVNWLGQLRLYSLVDLVLLLVAILAESSPTVSTSREWAHRKVPAKRQSRITDAWCIEGRPGASCTTRIGKKLSRSERCASAGSR